MVDVGLAWVLMEAGEIQSNRVISAVLGWGRAVLINGFLNNVGPDLELVKRTLRDVVGFKVTDPNMSQAEQLAMWRVVERVEKTQTST